MKINAALRVHGDAGAIGWGPGGRGARVQPGRAGPQGPSGLAGSP